MGAPGTAGFGCALTPPYTNLVGRGERRSPDPDAPRARPSKRPGFPAPQE